LGPLDAPGCPWIPLEAFAGQRRRVNIEN